MTTGQAPHKEIADDPGGEVRLEMARLAAAGTADGVEASALEVERDGPSYTYRTLELLAEENPGRELCFLLGADMAAGLGSWKNPERVVELARLGVVPRPGVGMERGATRRWSALGAADRAEIIEMPLCGVSSTLDQGAGGGGAAAAAPGAGPGGGADRGAGAVPVSARGPGARAPRRWRGGSPRSPTTRGRRTWSRSTCAGWSATRTSW